MNVKLSRNDIVTIANTINNLLSTNEKYPTTFSYFLSKNKRLLGEDVKEITTVINEKLKEYREEIINSKIVNEKNMITDVEKFKGIEEKYKAERVDVEKFMAEEDDVVVYGIRIDDIPDDISVNIMDVFFPLIITPINEEGN